MIMPKSDTVTVTRDAWNDMQAYIESLEKHIEDTKKDLEFLQALEGHGVDNWSGYSDAYSEVYGEDDEWEDDE